MRGGRVIKSAAICHNQKYGWGFGHPPPTHTPTCFSSASLCPGTMHGGHAACLSPNPPGRYVHLNRQTQTVGPLGPRRRGDVDNRRERCLRYAMQKKRNVGFKTLSGVEIKDPLYPLSIPYKLAGSGHSASSVT